MRNNDDLNNIPSCKELKMELKIKHKGSKV